MQFNTKDLLVTVLPKAGISAADLAKLCLFHTRICTSPTFCFHRTCYHGGSWGCLPCSHNFTCGHCSIAFTGGCGFQHSCGPGGSACDPTIFCAGASNDPFVIKDLEDLVTLRAELLDTVKKLDEIEKQVPSGVRTKAEAEALERGLTEALEQVRKARPGLK